MPEEVSVVVASEQVDVLAPPAEIRVSVGVGNQGQRGSRIYSGNQTPEQFFAALGESPMVGDMYVQVSAQRAFQYVSSPVGAAWSVLFDMVQLAESVVSPTTGLSWSGSTDISSMVTGPTLLVATLAGNTTLSLGTPSPDKAFTVTVVLTQGAGGSKTITATGVKWSYGVPPALSTAAGAIDILNFLWTGTVWIGLVGGMAFA